MKKVQFAKGDVVFREFETNRQMTVETRMQMEYLNQLLLMPEVLC